MLSILVTLQRSLHFGSWYQISHNQQSGTCSCQIVDVNSNDEIIVGGWFYNSVYFDSILLQQYQVTGNDAFVAKLGSGGLVMGAVSQDGSAAQIMDTGLEMINNLEINHQDEIFVSGEMVGTKSIFGSTTFSTTNSQQNGFVAKLDDAGNWQWASKFVKPSLQLKGI